MNKSKDRPSSGESDRHSVSFAAEDVEAARRLLALIAQPEERQPASADRGALRERARVALGLRQRRAELLGSDFSAEPPFDMLLALYVGESEEVIVTVTKVSELAYLTQSTALRWVDRLVSGGWVDRGNVNGDARKSRLSLTSKSRLALDQLFGCEE